MKRIAACNGSVLVCVCVLENKRTGWGVWGREREAERGRQSKGERERRKLNPFCDEMSGGAGQGVSAERPGEK